MISSKLELHDFRQASRLARYRFGFLIRLFTEHHSWIFGGCALVLTWTNVTGRTHESWKGIAGLYGLVAVAWLLPRVFMEARLRTKLARLNETETGMEVKPSGVHFHLRDGSVRTMPWERFLAARMGSRVLLLFYMPQKGRIRRRKFLTVPLRELSRDQRNEVLLALPARLRNANIRRELEQWRLA